MILVHHFQLENVLMFPEQSAPQKGKLPLCKDRFGIPFSKRFQKRKFLDKRFRHLTKRKLHINDYLLRQLPFGQCCLVIDMQLPLCEVTESFIKEL